MTDMKSKKNMGSQWTSKYAILRDLSFAQGRKVPTAIVDSVKVGQKPPPIKIKEDTEEEFFENCAGDGDVYAKPDLTLIKKMINMVQESDLADGDNGDDDTEKVVEISKLNPSTKEFALKTKVVGAESNEAPDMVAKERSDNNIDIEAKVKQINAQPEVKPKKKRRERNVALISLLEKEKFSPDKISPESDRISTSMNQTSQATNNMQGLEVKLLKPNDFITDTNIIESVEKVNEWLEKPAESQVENTKLINIPSNSMFKKKSPAPISLKNTCTFKRKSDTSSIKSSDSDTVPRQTDNLFVPSTHANEYYKKFVERSQVQEMAREDIWERAERLMKEVDAKRLKEQEKNIGETIDNVDICVDLGDDQSGPRSSLPFNIPGVNTPSVRQTVLLPRHRHELPERCKVCLSFAKYNRANESSP